MLKKSIIALMFCGAMATMPMAAQDANTTEPVAMETTVVADNAGEAIEEVAVVSEDNAGEALTAQQQKAENLKENDPNGGALTLMSMCIVIFALIVLSLLFLCFGKVSSKLQGQRKKEARGSSDESIEASLPDSGEAIAAIAAALAEHFSGKHDMEDTILTIKRMKRAYSPWNSKIYNMREVPQLKKR
jgi:Na+-transporting methylmalonyl-CoA/oxaloacetate decarboxylase gamma subunit